MIEAEYGGDIKDMTSRTTNKHVQRTRRDRQRRCVWCGVFSGRVGTLMISVVSEIDEAYKWRKKDLRR